MWATALLADAARYCHYRPLSRAADAIPAGWHQFWLAPRRAE